MLNLNYTFKDASLLDLALTQSGANAANNNERLEFIGDRVLGLTVAKMLYDMYPHESEGELARRHAMLVSTDTLADVAEKIGVAGAVRHGHMTGGKVITEFWTELASADATAPKDPKTALQELVQKMDAGALPVYEYLPPTGASHSPVFNVRVTAMGRSADGQGTSKKTASIAAAASLMKILAI